jgi:hypothetical protein
LGKGYVARLNQPADEPQGRHQETTAIMDGNRSWVVADDVGERLFDEG